MLRLTFADQCAWRAVYIYLRDPEGKRAGDKLIITLGFDPGDCGRATLFGQLFGRIWRIKLPRSNRWARFDGRNAYYLAQRDLRKQRAA